MKRTAMRTARWAVSLVFAVMSCSAMGQTNVPARKAPEPKALAGMNLTYVSDWNTELPFVDVFRLSRTWISQRQGETWGKGPALDLDECGWVKRLEPGCYADTLMCTIQGGHFPGGDYTVLYDGEGEIEMLEAAAITARAPGRLTVRVDPARGRILLRLRATNPNNYVRNIHVIMPGFLQTWRENPWHPVFYNRWKGMACLRFKDWQLIDKSVVAAWSERPTPDEATFTRKGVPLEWLIDLSNRLQIDPWFCMPHQADDDYVRQFARMVKEKLDPKLRVYVEYSNETWNTIYAQNKYVNDSGVRMKFGDEKRPWEAGWRYTAWRSVQVFKIWEEVFGGTQRLVRLLPSQAANVYVSRQIVTFQDAWRSADALTVAPYFTCNVMDQGNGPKPEAVAAWTTNQALDYMENTALPMAVKWIQEQKKLADEYGLKLIAYEGGQHFVGVRNVQNSDAVTKLGRAINLHPRMGLLYRKYLDVWAREGGDLFCLFASLDPGSKYGNWGLLEYYDDNPARMPKFMAVMEWAKARGQGVQSEGGRTADGN